MVFFGAILRFTLAYLVSGYIAHPFPIATLIINFLGSVAIGLVFEFFRGHHLLPMLSIFLGVGFLGSFTTFSTFSFETIDLIKRSHYQFAVLNILASILLCGVGVLVGEWIGRCCRV